MKVSVIIPTLNEARILSSSIEKAWQSGADEVIVVDGGSTDSTAIIAESSECKLLKSAPGRGRQMNAGAAAAAGDVLLFLHADTTLVEHGCDQIREAMTKDAVACGAFRQNITNPGFIYRSIETGNALRVKLFSMAYGDQGIFVRRRIFQQLTGFEEIPLMEDFCFSMKIRRRFKYELLEGPLTVSPRRWERNGPIRQTITNWSIALASIRGIEPEILARKYFR